MRVYSYVITANTGCAPNYDAPSVTLALCKPRIRAAACQGDLVLAFNGKSLSRDPHSVCWAGIVCEVLPMNRYWNDERFERKKPDGSHTKDNIYEPDDNGGLTQVENCCHNDSNVKKDIKGRNVLIFSDAWHMGGSQPLLPEEFKLRLDVESRQGHRVNCISVQEWDELEKWLVKNNKGIPEPQKCKPCSPCKPKTMPKKC
jgi:Nucleotide modification associated domain 2